MCQGETFLEVQVLTTYLPTSVAQIRRTGRHGHSRDFKTWSPSENIDYQRNALMTGDENYPWTPTASSPIE